MQHICQSELVIYHQECPYQRFLHPEGLAHVITTSNSHFSGTSPIDPFGRVLLDSNSPLPKPWIRPRMPHRNLQASIEKKLLVVVNYFILRII